MCSCLSMSKKHLNYPSSFSSLIGGGKRGCTTSSASLVGLFFLDTGWACVECSSYVFIFAVQVEFPKFEELVIWLSGVTGIEVKFGWRVIGWKVVVEVEVDVQAPRIKRFSGHNFSTSQHHNLTLLFSVVSWGLRSARQWSLRSTFKLTPNMTHLNF